MPLPRLAGAVALVLAALLLPPNDLAVTVADPALAAQVGSGLWILKAALFFLAVLVGCWGVFRFGEGESLTALGERVQPTRGELWAVGGFILAGALLRLTDLGTGLWYDEIETLVNYVRLPLGQIVTTYDSQNNHLFYSILARISFLIFGESAWALRLPAALMGIASLWAAWRFARRAGGRVEGMLVLALLTFSYQHVWFSQNARGYTGLLLFTLLGSFAFLELLGGPAERRRRDVAIYAITMAFATWTHVTGAFVVLAHGLIWTVLSLRGGRRGRMAPLAAMVLAGFGSILLYAPVLPQLFGTILT
ncbi:MAG: glycosyltransferase family 39 protein, partial [Gemmatimonadales bacterium]